jgi:hypothetical protein
VSIDPVPYLKALLVALPSQISLGIGSPPEPRPTLNSYQFVAEAHGVHPVGLKVTTTQDAQAGLFVATVTAAKSDGSSNSTKVKVNVLPTTRESQTARCAAFDTAPIGGDDVPIGSAAASTNLIATTPFSGPSSTIIPGLFDQKEKNPHLVQWNIGYGVTDGGVALTLSKAGGALPTLQSNQAHFFFQNTTSSDRQFVLFNTSTCTPTGVVTVKPNEYGSVLLASRPPTTTLLLRRHGDNGGKTWQADSVLSTGPFWTVFGGKVVDLNWF